MDGDSRPRGKFAGRLTVAALAGLLLCASVAYAVVGLQNPSFENDLDNWTVSSDRDTGDSARSVVYGPGGSNGEVVPCDDSAYGVCVVGTDTFDYPNGGDYTDIRTATVSPLQGDKMLRLGGPFENENVQQNQDRFVVEQTFTVDPENPVLEINRNVYTWDYSGYDEFEFRVTVTDDEGGVVARDVAGSFGTGTDLKTTGWRPMTTDLSAYAGQQMHVRISSGGTSDEAYGFWTYVDAGLVPEPPVDPEKIATEAPLLPGGGKVNVNSYTDPSSGQTFITVPNSQIAQFPSGCMPLTITVPIEPGAGTVSDVSLLLAGSPHAMSKVGDTNNWTVEIPCVENGDLFLEYTLTEGASSQVFTIPLGGLVLIDPQGVIHDQDEYDAAIAEGVMPAEARSAAAIEGATATLQRETGTDGVFETVLSGDPGITPNVNPQTTGADGLYQWDVSAGTYQVVASAPGYVTEIGGPVDIPPPVFDLHIALDKYDTSITGGPGATTADSTPTFTFSGNDPEGSTFECSVDGGEFGPCSGNGTHTTGALTDGQHTFSVQGTDSNAFTDPTPASRTFTVTSTACVNKTADVEDAEAALAAAQSAATKANDDADAAAADADAKAKAAKEAQEAADKAKKKAKAAKKKIGKAKGKQAKKEAKAKAKAAKKKAKEAKKAASAALAAANQAEAKANQAQAAADAADKALADAQANLDEAEEAANAACAGTR